MQQIPMDDVSQLLITVPETIRESIAYFLNEVQPTGFEERDQETLQSIPSGQVQFAFWAPRALAEERISQIEKFIEQLRSLGENPDPWSHQISDVDPKSWQEAYKAFFKPARIGQSFVVKPSWEDFTALKTDMVIELDPGMAFGTGLHASTQLIMRTLEHLNWHEFTPRTVLDLGCGTGILSIAAAKIWPGVKITALDNDDVAVGIARENIKHNQVQSRIDTLHGPAKEFLRAQGQGSWDLILANIHFEVLQEMKNELRAALHPKAKVILSGLLSAQAQTLCEQFAGDLAFESEYAEEIDGWRALLLRRGK